MTESSEMEIFHLLGDVLRSPFDIGIFGVDTQVLHV